MLAASPGGKLVSVGLDRAIQVWNVPTGSRDRVQSDPEVPLENPFPVLNVALDDRSKWLALVSWQRVFIWNMEEKQWADVREIDLGGHRPEAVFFVTKAPGAAPSLVLIRRNGMGLEVPVTAGDARDFMICRTPLVWAVSFTEKCKSQSPADSSPR
jgi:WD40 repeat protein